MNWTSVEFPTLRRQASTGHGGVRVCATRGTLGEWVPTDGTGVHLLSLRSLPWTHVGSEWSWCAGGWPHSWGPDWVRCVEGRIRVSPRPGRRQGTDEAAGEFTLPTNGHPGQPQSHGLEEDDGLVMGEASKVTFALWM